MTKTQLISSLAQRTGMKHKDAEIAFGGMIDLLIETLAKGEKVQLPGFGTFTVKERAPRTARNPHTGETVAVPATRYLSFSVGKTMKEQL